MAGSQGSGCFKGFGCFVLLSILLVIGLGLAGMYYIDSKTVSPLQPERFSMLSDDICSSSIPDSCTPRIGIDLPFARGTFFIDSENGITNAYLMTMDTPLVQSLDKEYTDLVEP